MHKINNRIIKLKIAGIIIEVQSRFGLAPPDPFIGGEERQLTAERLANFFYKGRENPHIRIKVMVADKLPRIHKARHIFTTYHFQDGGENWHLFKKGGGYIYKSHLPDKKQLMLVNRTFDMITAYLLPKEKRFRVWCLEDIVYDFLQVLLINYFALDSKGIFVHGIGIKDLDGKGLLFAGKSGCGKTTTARLWHKHSKAMVLNDDRIIVRKLKNKFFIYGSPWHGEFSDYLASKIDSAPLKRLFFIYHSSKNVARRISEKAAFNSLYPAIFPTFWDKKNLEKIVSFCQDLIKGVSCYSLGFLNNKRVIDFVKGVGAR